MSRDAPPRDLRTVISRRRLLRGLSALTVALTTPVWRPATAFGQDQARTPPRRFIGLFSANGTVAKDFFPAASGADSPLTLGRILAPLAPHRARINVLKGVHMNSTVEDELGVAGALKPGGPHMKGPGAMLTGGSLGPGSFTGAGGPAGWADRISVDQFIAKRWAAPTAFPSLELGVRVLGQEPLRVISYRGADQPNPTTDDPWAVYTRLFTGRDLSASALARLRAEQQGVLSFLKGDLAALRARVAADDKLRLDAHLEGLSSIERRLTASEAACALPTLPGKVDPRAMESYPLVQKLQLDLLVLAHACDLTRVSTFMWANADSWQYYPWIGVNEEHHALSHAADDDVAAADKLVKINAWHAEQVKYLLDGLAGAAASDGSSLLDHSLVLWGNELGVGNTHTYKDIPWLLAGGAGGALRQGRFLQYQDRPHNDLLVSVCHAMGLDDVRSFGLPGVCTGPLSGLAT